MGQVIKFSYLLIILALGLPVIYSTYSFALDIPCTSHKSETYGFEDLITQARVYGEKDRRGELSKLALGLKLTKAQSDQIRAAVGALYCDADGSLPAFSSTAFIIGNNREITTAGHELQDAFGRPRNLAGCYFENFEIPHPKRFKLKLQSPRNIIPAQAEINDRRDDRARLELESPATEIRPLMPDFSGQKLEPGTPTFLVAAQHDDFKSSGIDPIVSPCTVQDYYDSGDGVSRMKTDCDSSGGSSGGVYFIQVDGEIYAKAMQVSEKKKGYGGIPNHSSYNKDSNFAKALVIDQSFLGWYIK